MADPFPEFNLSENETVPAVSTQAPSSQRSSNRSMGAVEIGVIAVALAITILAMSAVISLSRRR